MKYLFARIILFAIVFLAFYLRTYNVNWDSGTHIHPDERFLTMVTSDMKIPSSFFDYLNPQISTMNPHNIGYGFFVYGTFPLYLVKILAIILKMNNYDQITIVGRYASAMFDMGIVVFLYFVSKLLYSFAISAKTKILNSFNKKTCKEKNFDFLRNDMVENWLPLFPPFLYSIMVLPIQLSHFFAVDTFLAFFMILSFYLSLLIFKKIKVNKYVDTIFLSFFLGVSIGLGFACKVTMIFIMPLDFLIILSGFFNEISKNKFFNFLKFGVWKFLGIWILIFGIFILFFRMAMPMAFADFNFLNFSPNPKWIKNLTDLQNMSLPSLSNTFPPAIQWFTTKPIIFPLKNMFFWGMGIPIALICIIGLVINFYLLFFNLIKNRSFFSFISPLFLLSFFVIVFFIYQGSQFVKAMRYIYPIYWCFAFLGSLFVAKILEHPIFFMIKRRRLTLYQKTLAIFIFFTILISVVFYPFSFLQIYEKPHTRVAASRWMFDNLKPGSTVTFEEWDDPLPLLVDGKSNLFPGNPLPMFWPDTDKNNNKWQIIADRISKADYIILSSNRVYGSIPRRPDIYPITAKYYQKLFNGELGFKKVAEFVSRPTVPFLNYEFIDDNADESFTVYDHPKVLIYKNSEKFSAGQLFHFISL